MTVETELQFLVRVGAATATGIYALKSVGQVLKDLGAQGKGNSITNLVAVCCLAFGFAESVSWGLLGNKISRNGGRRSDYPWMIGAWVHIYQSKFSSISLSQMIGAMALPSLAMTFSFAVQISDEK